MKRWRLLNSVRFPTTEGDPVDVREVRRYVRELLADDYPKLIDDIVLMVDEVATNSVIHTLTGRPGGRLGLAVYTDGSDVRVEMTDCGGTDTTPEVQQNPTGMHGRGMLIISVLAGAYGWVKHKNGQTTMLFETGTDAGRSSHG